MSAAVPTSIRFRTACERAGLSVAEVATRAGVSEACVWDLENFDDELMSVYSAADLQRFASVLSVAPRELVGTEERGVPISAEELASAIREHCRARGLTFDELGDAAGWDVSRAVDVPQLLLTDISIDGVVHVCRELGVDWHRFISGLSPAA